MHGTRTLASAPVATALAALAALAIASAPAASGDRAQARPHLAGELARSQPPRTGDSFTLSLAARGANAGRLAGRLADVTGSRDARWFRPSVHGVTDVPGDRARVVVETDSPEQARAAAVRVGGRVERVAPGLVQVLVPPAQLARLSRQAGVRHVRPPFHRTELAVSGEQVGLTLASTWHRAGLSGKGVKVAVIDSGFSGLAERQADGELPANAITADYCGGDLRRASEHGTAVAEIVHEMAPEAQLYLVCVDTEVDLAAAVEYVKSQGVHVVNHSIGWFGPSRGDGTGWVGRLVADARAAGILWVNAAGNEAETHWSGTFSGGGDRVHDWAPDGDEGNTFVWPDDVEVCGLLKWDEWPAAVSDFDLALVEAGSNRLIEISEEYQTGTEPPFEALCMGQSTGHDVLVYWAILGFDVRSSPRFDLFSFSPPLEHAVAAGSVVDPATSQAAVAVGALCWQSGALEPFSSQGPTIDGRTKPDLVGHDSVSGATYGSFTSCPSAFAGTSASSPEVAGAAALVKQAYPRLGPDELRDYLVRSARDVAPAGPDGATGAGELRLPGPPDVAPPTVTALTGRGRRGRAVVLPSRIADNSGEFRVEAQVKRGGRVVATLRRGYVTARGTTRVTFTWRAPASGRGTFRHCVRAFDRAGNASAVSCAAITLR